jgi:hypothetical protein
MPSNEREPTLSTAEIASYPRLFGCFRDRTEGAFEGVFLKKIIFDFKSNLNFRVELL